MHTPPPDSLFASITPRARKADPVTSKRAAKAAAPRANSHAAKILADVRAHPGATSSEIASRLPDVDRVAVSRRLPDIEERGHVKRGDIRLPDLPGAKNEEMTWWPKGAA